MVNSHYANCFSQAIPKVKAHVLYSLVYTTRTIYKLYDTLEKPFCSIYSQNGEPSSAYYVNCHNELDRLHTESFSELIELILSPQGNSLPVFSENTQFMYSCGLNRSFFLCSSSYFHKYRTYVTSCYIIPVQSIFSKYRCILIASIFFDDLSTVRAKHVCELHIFNIQ